MSISTRAVAMTHSGRDAGTYGKSAARRSLNAASARVCEIARIFVCAIAPAFAKLASAGEARSLLERTWRAERRPPWSDEDHGHHGFASFGRHSPSSGRELRKARAEFRRGDVFARPTLCVMPAQAGIQ